MPDSRRAVPEAYSDHVETRRQIRGRVALKIRAGCTCDLALFFPGYADFRRAETLCGGGLDFDKRKNRTPRHDQVDFSASRPVISPENPVTRSCEHGRGRVFPSLAGPQELGLHVPDARRMFILVRCASGHSGAFRRASGMVGRPHPFKGHPVDPARAMYAQCPPVLCAAIPLVVREAVFREFFMESVHLAVSGHFGEYGCGRNGERNGIAVDHGGLTVWTPGYAGAVHKNAIGWDAKPLDGTAHGEIGGLQDIDAVDFFRRSLANAMGNSDFGDPRVKARPPVRREYLGVVQAGNHDIPGKNHRGGDDRTGQRSASGFVDTRNVAKAPLVQLLFQGPHFLQARMFGRDGFSASALSKDQTANAGARIGIQYIQQRCIDIVWTTKQISNLRNGETGYIHGNEFLANGSGYRGC